MARPNSRDPKKHPAALLGQRLGRLRITAGLPTHEAAAKAFGYSRETITKVESGERTPTDQVFSTYLEKCNATPAQAESLREDLELARNAEPVVPEFAEPWLKIEPEATIIRAWGLNTIPSNSRSTTTRSRCSLSTVWTRIRPPRALHSVSSGRRSSTNPTPTRMTAILYEPLLNCLVGTATITAGELEHLLKMSDRPNVIIQVVRESGYFPGMDGQFQMASGRTIPDTLNMIAVRDQTINDPVVVEEASALFETIRSYALSAAESRTLIQEALQRWKNQQ